MKELVSKVTKLIDVKSIMTLALTIGFILFVANGFIDPEKYATVYLMIVTFYFGTQYAKNSNKE